MFKQLSLGLILMALLVATHPLHAQTTLRGAINGGFAWNGPGTLVLRDVPLPAGSDAANPVMLAQVVTGEIQIAQPAPLEAPPTTEETKEPAKTDPPKADPNNETLKAKSDTPKLEPDVITFMLLDGSVITGKLSVKEITVETQFGKLTVPVSSIRTFTPGLTSHPEMGKNLEQLIKNLGSSSFNEREAAQKSLEKIGPPARAELQKFVDDTDTERRKRVKALLEIFDQQMGEDDDLANPQKGGLQRGDVIETVDFTIVGKIGPTSFDMSTQYGQLNIKLVDIQRGHRIVEQKEEIRKSVTVDGGQIVQKTMKDTTIRVERGDKINISADGTMTMSPWGNNAISSPDGAPNYSWYIPNQIPIGCLVGRIGKDGPVFKVGSKATITAERAGVLMLGIGMDQNYINQRFPGEYTAKIRIEKK